MLARGFILLKFYIVALQSTTMMHILCVIATLAEHGGAAVWHDCDYPGHLGAGHVPADGAGRDRRQEHAHGVQRAVQDNQVRRNLVAACDTTYPTPSIRLKLSADASLAASCTFTAHNKRSTFDPLAKFLNYMMACVAHCCVNRAQVPEGGATAAVVPHDGAADADGRVPALQRHLHRAVLHLRQRLGPQGDC